MFMREVSKLLDQPQLELLISEITFDVSASIV
jgi:hypothetical protein